MEKRYMSIIVAASLFTTLHASSLKETVTETLLTNSEIISNQLKIKSAQKDIEIQEAGYYPTLDLEAYFEKSQTQNHEKYKKREEWAEKDGYRATLKASQLLYDGGNTPSKVREKKYTYNESVYKYTQRNETIVYDIVEAYNDIVKYTELRQIMEYGDDAHKKALEVAYDKEEISGEALETLKTLNLISIQEDKKLALDIDIEKAQSKYRNLTSMESTSNLCRPDYDETKIPNNLKDLINLALENSYKIKEQKAIIRAQREIITQEDSKYQPDFRLNLSAAFDEDLELEENGEQKEVIGQFLMNWNFYSGGKDSNTYDKEKIRLSEEYKNLERVTNDVVENITNLFYTYKHAQNRIENFEKSIKSNEEILALTKDQLEDGTKTFIDLLQVKNKLLDSQSNKVKQEFVMLNTYYKILEELSMLSQTIINGENQICTNKTVENLIDEGNKKEENLDDLLNIDSDLNSGIEGKENTQTNEANESELIQETTTLSIDDQVSELFSTNKNVNYDKESSSITIRTNPDSFKRSVLNKNSNFAYKLNSFSSDFMQILDKNKEQIRALHIEVYTSSEYRSVEGLENKFKANLKASKKRAKEVKDYFMKKSIQNNLDTQWFSQKTIDIGKGSMNLVKDSHGIEDREASRRVVIKLIKR